MKRRSFLKSSSALGLTSVIGITGVLGSSCALASDVGDFPSKPIRILVGFSAGGATDMVVRSLAEAASKVFNQRVIVENKPGAGGVMPAYQLLNERANSLTLGIVPVSVFRLPYIVGVDWDPVEDLEYIIRLTGFLWGIVVPASSPIKTFQDYVEYAREHPGELTYGTVGSLTTQHLTMEQISRQLDIEFNHIPFQGVADGIHALMGGHIDSVADASSWVPYVESGEMRLLVVWGDKRVERFPDVPTLKEVGIDMVQTSPWGLAAAKGTSAAHIKILHDGFKEAMEDPKFLSTLKQYDMDIQYLNSADFKLFAEEAVSKEEQILEALNVPRKK